MHYQNINTGNIVLVVTSSHTEQLMIVAIIIADDLVVVGDEAGLAAAEAHLHAVPLASPVRRQVRLVEPVRPHRDHRTPVPG